MEPIIEKIIRKAIEEAIPFNRHLGITLEEARMGYALLKLPYADQLIGNPLIPALHGGVIAALIDTTGGAAAMTCLASLEDRLATIDMRVDYLLPGKPQELFAEAKVIRNGNRLVVTRISAWQVIDGEQAQIADATAVYNAIRKKNQPPKGC